MDDSREKSERSGDFTDNNTNEYDSENRYLFDDDESTTLDGSILRQFGWTTTTTNTTPHNLNPRLDDHPFSHKSESSSAVCGGVGSGLLQITTEMKTPSGVVEQASASTSYNPSVSSSSSDQDLVEKSETPPPSLQIPSTKKKGQKRIRQQRFAFVTKSDVDHLEDGYRWRKYGQKAVKNSPYPRSYYRCTNTKCTVKKRVERSCEDPTTVITTYEGQHCHPIAGFPRGGGISIREAAFGVQMGPPNSQFYHSALNLPQPSPQLSNVPNPQLTSVPSEPNDASVMISGTTKPQLHPAISTPQFSSDEGLLGDIVSPRLRKPHP